jgi:3-oxoacyl-[acyl-carrier protein] reductase
MKPLEAKVAIVTGAGRPRGMGRATALKLAERGAHVVVTDIARPRKDLEVEGMLGVGDDFAALEALAKEIETLGVRALPMAVDVTDRGQIDACVARACDELGGVDVLFNNAGAALGVGPFLEMTAQQWDLSYEVNVRGTAWFCQAAIPSMIERGGGAIVNNASLAGIGAVEQMAGYSATKFAVVGLTKAIAAEFGRHGIRCNAVCPGLIDTLMGQSEVKLFAAGSSEEVARERLARGVALGRWAEPEEVADAVVYLAGPEASYLSGVALPVAGGMPPGL